MRTIKSLESDTPIQRVERFEDEYGEGTLITHKADLGHPEVETVQYDDPDEAKRRMFAFDTRQFRLGHTYLLYIPELGEERSCRITRLARGNEPYEAEVL